MSAVSITTKRQIVRAAIDAAGSRFITVAFTKKDGSERVMTFHPEAVKTHPPKNPDPSRIQAAVTRRLNHPNLMPVYDVQAEAIRSINLDTVTSLVVDGKRIEFALNVQ